MTTASSLTPLLDFVCVTLPEGARDHTDFPWHVNHGVSLKFLAVVATYITFFLVAERMTHKSHLREGVFP